MTSKETLNYCRQLIRDLFCGRKHRCKEEPNKIRRFLYTRAWIIYSAILVEKVIRTLSGNAFWQKAYSEKKIALLEDLNLKFVDQTESIVVGAEIFMIVLGLLLSILTWKYRRFARIQIYHGLITLLIQAFIPQDVDSLMTEICLQTIFLYFCTASGAGSEIIAVTIVCFVLLMT